MDRRDLQLSGVPRSVEEQLASAIQEDRGINDAVPAVRALLAGCPWDWPAEHRWRQVFREQGSFPQMWEGLEADPPLRSVAFNEWDGALGSLSYEARCVLLGGFWTMSLQELQTRTGYSGQQVASVTDELVESDLAAVRTSLPDLLEALSYAELKGIQKAQGHKGGRGKRETIRKMLAQIAEETILASLPRELPTEVVWFRQIPEEARDYETYIRDRVFLYTHFLQFCRYGEGNLRQYAENAEDLGGYVELSRPHSEDRCPHCRKTAGRVIALTDLQERDVPPLHPGCRCTVLWKPAKRRHVVSRPPAPTTTRARSQRRSGCAVLFVAAVVLVLWLLG